MRYTVIIISSHIIGDTMYHGMCHILPIILSSKEEVSSYKRVRFDIFPYNLKRYLKTTSNGYQSIEFKLGGRNKINIGISCPVQIADNIYFLSRDNIVPYTVLIVTEKSSLFNLVHAYNTLGIFKGNERKYFAQYDVAAMMMKELKTLQNIDLVYSTALKE